MGFAKEQFGSPADDFTTYLTSLLDEIELLVKDIVGDEYDDATTDSIAEMRLRYAEKYFAAGELWRRIEIVERRNNNLSRSDGGQETVSSRPLRNAERYEDIAWDYLSYFGISRETYRGGISVGFSESGPFAAVS